MSEPSPGRASRRSRRILQLYFLNCRAYASSVGSYSLQLHSYRILRPQLSAHHYSIKQFSEKLHVLQSAVIFKNLDTLRSCFSVQALCFCIVFLDHVKYLQIHATSAASTLADWHTQKIHACSEVGSRPTLQATKTLRRVHCAHAVSVRKS